MKDLQTLLIILTAALFFTACEKEETPDLWTISGEVLMQDAQVSTITSPLADVEMYLLNFPFTVDSITDWVAQSDILKTTQTNASGLYTFSELQAGDYIVMPLDTTKGYKFSWSESPDSIWTSSTNSKSAYTMDFLTPEVHAENNSNSYTFKFNNSGPFAQAYIYIIRKRKKREFHGFKLGWSDWEWKITKNFGTYNQPAAMNCSYTDKLEDTWFNKYADEYKISLAAIQTAQGTMEDRYRVEYPINNLKKINVFNLEWQLDSVIITQE